MIQQFHVLVVVFMSVILPWQESEARTVVLYEETPDLRLETVYDSNEEYERGSNGDDMAMMAKMAKMARMRKMAQMKKMYKKNMLAKMEKWATRCLRWAISTR